MTQNIKNIPFDIDVADERLRPLCEMYWEIDSTGEFAHSLEEIAEKFNIPPLEIHNLVRTLSRAWKSGVVCIKCKENGPFYSRYEYDRAPLQNFICFDCEQEALKKITLNKSLIHLIFPSIKKMLLKSFKKYL